MINIDQVILGDNQFFGVNHMSQDKGKASYEQFKDLNEIKRILDYSVSKGVNAVMFSTHPSIYEICDMIRSDEVLRKELKIYVNVPYIIKYVSMVTEIGMFETIKTTLKGYSGTDKLKYLLKTSFNAIMLDYVSIMNRLVDVELAPFYDLNIKAVFLHNALCDLCLGYEMKDAIQGFDKHIRETYNAIPGYGTLNYPKFAKFLDDAGLKNSLVMTSFNKNGFLMNPNIKACEDSIQEHGHTILAMATLASGRLHPEEAYSYLSGIGIKNVAVGLSSKKHADETFDIIKKYILDRE